TDFARLADDADITAQELYEYYNNYPRMIKGKRNSCRAESPQELIRSDVYAIISRKKDIQLLKKSLKKGECNINCVSKECVRFLTHTVFYLIE
ncbi:hypothetical protein P8785_02035, partial [Bacillus subtilis]|uniref:hypothetical protein n=1 Tax=Bacillus subtilis TaxID=1423 RepID=UPI002DBBB010